MGIRESTVTVEFSTIAYANIFAVLRCFEKAPKFSFYTKK